MSYEFLRKLPESNQEARNQIYDGDIFLLAANEASLQFVDSVLELVQVELGDNFHQAHAERSPEDFFAAIGRLRKSIYTSDSFHRRVNEVIESFGFALDHQAYDPARLRVVAHNGHLNPAAAPVYYGHRDTWYSNHQAMITWWIPLHDVVAEETFEFFPEEFARPVHNDSEIFDFDAWVSKGQEKRIGWQNKKTGTTAAYPSLLEAPRSAKLPVIARAGEVLIFSGQQLHQTRDNVTGRTRFSLDFRTVDLTDVEQGRQASNVDNRSTGSSMTQFIRPNSKQAGR